MAGQVGYGPLARVDGPPPLAPLYGLLKAADGPDQGVRLVPDVDERGIERWMNGVQVYPYPVDTAEVFDTCALGSDGVTKSGGTAPPLPIFGAMTVVLPIECTSYRVGNTDEFKQRAVAAFMAVESAAVAREFMSGDVLIENPHLADGEGDFPNGNTVTSAINGLAILEDHIAQSGRQGIIHCTPGLAASALRNHFAIDNRSGVLRTINGTVVIADQGYAQAKSDGVATPKGRTAPTLPLQEWLYATGLLDVRRTEVFVNPPQVAQAVDRGTGATLGTPNSITFRAERYYLIDWDTVVQAAVLVDRCQDSC